MNDRQRHETATLVHQVLDRSIIAGTLLFLAFAQITLLAQHFSAGDVGELVLVYDMMAFGLVAYWLKPFAVTFYRVRETRLGKVGLGALAGLVLVLVAVAGGLV